MKAFLCFFLSLLFFTLLSIFWSAFLLSKGTTGEKRRSGCYVSFLYLSFLLLLFRFLSVLTSAISKPRHFHDRLRVNRVSARISKFSLGCCVSIHATDVCPTKRSALTNIRICTHPHICIICTYEWEYTHSERSDGPTIYAILFDTLFDKEWLIKTWHKSVLIMQTAVREKWQVGMKKTKKEEVVQKKKTALGAMKTCPFGKPKTVSMERVQENELCAYVRIGSKRIDRRR